MTYSATFGPLKLRRSYATLGSRQLRRERGQKLEVGDDLPPYTVSAIAAIQGALSQLHDIGPGIHEQDLDVAISLYRIEEIGLEVAEMLGVRDEGLKNVDLAGCLERLAELADWKTVVNLCDPHLPGRLGSPELHEVECPSAQLVLRVEGQSPTCVLQLEIGEPAEIAWKVILTRSAYDRSLAAQVTDKQAELDEDVGARLAISGVECVVPREDQDGAIDITSERDQSIDGNITMLECLCPRQRLVVAGSQACCDLVYQRDRAARAADEDLGHFRLLVSALRIRR